ncbi:MAG: dipeptidase PepE [Chitinophagaceae bacterium]
MPQNLLLASTSTLFGGAYLAYLKDALMAHFKGINTMTFVPFARPSGISHEDYTARAAGFFKTLGIKVQGLHSFSNAKKAIAESEAFFTGGGNTFLLVKTLHEQGLMQPLKARLLQGVPYLGCSAGTNIAGISMQTTNDMPIVYPPSFETLGLVPFNVNPHYLDPNPALRHNGETRETRITEFLTQNNIPVVGLREGSWLEVKGETIALKGNLSARIFEKDKAPYELESGHYFPQRH